MSVPTCFAGADSSRTPNTRTRSNGTPVDCWPSSVQIGWANCRHSIVSAAISRRAKQLSATAPSSKTPSSARMDNYDRMRGLTPSSRERQHDRAPRRTGSRLREIICSREYVAAVEDVCGRVGRARVDLAPPGAPLPTRPEPAQTCVAATATSRARQWGHTAARQLSAYTRWAPRTASIFVSVSLGIILDEICLYARKFATKPFRLHPRLLTLRQWHICIARLHL